MTFEKDGDIFFRHVGKFRPKTERHIPEENCMAVMYQKLETFI